MSDPEPATPAEREPADPEIGPAEPEPALPAQPEPALPAQPEIGSELEVRNGNEYFKICVPLHNAALEGNWEAAKQIIEEHSQTILEEAIASGGSTILHVAAGARKRTFVEKLLESVKQNDDLTSKLLLKRDEQGNNAFCFAAATGDVEIAKLMLKKKPGLQNFRGSNYKTPLYLAVLFGQKDMANFLYPRTVKSLNQDELNDLFIGSISADLYGITLKLLDHCKNHTTIPLIWGTQGQAQDIDENGTGAKALYTLAQKPNLKTDDARTLLKRLWNSLIDSYKSNQVKKLIKRQINMLFDAAKLGNFEFIGVAVRFYPDLIYELDDTKHSIFHIAVQHRHVDIFDLISMMGFHKDLLTTFLDKDDNNILHLAAKYPNPPPTKMVPGAALELQREILMFEVVEKIFQPSYRDQKIRSVDIQRATVKQQQKTRATHLKNYSPRHTKI